MIDNEIQTFPIDEKFQRVMKFAQNKKTLHQSSGISNLYLIQKTDIDGNITGEYYGENLFTDYGMSSYFITGTAFPTNIYIGDGTGSFNKTTNILLNAITTASSVLSNNTKSYAYPMYYDKISGLVTCICKYMDCYFDYSIKDVNNDVVITEYGIGTAYNQLWTHSWVYDISGAQSSITKNVNERLTFTVFMCMSYYETLITDNYANGIYSVITSMQRFFDDKMYEHSIGTFKRDTFTSRSKTNVSSGLMNNEVSRYTNMSTFALYYDDTNGGNYIDGFTQSSTGFEIIERQTLSIAEPVDIISYTYEPDISNECFAKALGRTGYLPFTQFSPTHVRLFNHKTNKWDIEETFVGDPNIWNSENLMSTTFSNMIYYTNNDIVQLMYIYQNLRMNDPIIALNNPDLETIYVTDKYWDIKSWELLTDYDNIPVELQKKRYWITHTNSVSLLPKRGLPYFRVIPDNGDIVKFELGFSKYYKRYHGNYDYGWYVRDSDVCIPSTNTSFKIADTSWQRTRSYGKWMLTFVNSLNSSFYLTDMSDLSTIPTPQQINLDFSSNVNIYNQCYITKNDLGLFGFQSSYDATNNQFIVLDLNSETLQQYVYSSIMGCCIWNTTKIAYIPTDDQTIIRIYDIETQSITKEIPLIDDILCESFLICGHSNYVWITNGSTITYVCNINSGAVTLCEGNINIIQTMSPGINNADVECVCVDDVMIVYRMGGHNNHGVLINIKDEPNKIISTHPFEVDNTYIRSEIDYDLRYIHDDTLVMCLTQNCSSGTYAISTVVDLGLYLHTNEISVKRYENGMPFIPYGKFIINAINNRVPIEYYLPHRFIGTTNTITALNNIKQISGKQWSQTITNIPTFNGLPPGNMQ